MGGRHSDQNAGEQDVGRQMEREFYQQLSAVVRTWEMAFAGLEVHEQQRIAAAAAESGLLQAIQMARAALMRYERNQRRGEP
jgi:creatinine amidohydrolase/Fe(II)-dependent formamide hydrolase-like protein